MRENNENSLAPKKIIKKRSNLLGSDVQYFRNSMDKQYIITRSQTNLPNTDGICCPPYLKHNSTVTQSLEPLRQFLVSLVNSLGNSWRVSFKLTTGRVKRRTLWSDAYAPTDMSTMLKGVYSLARTMFLHYSLYRN